MTEALHSLRILLAEDSEEDAFLLIRHLRKVGYEIESRRVESSTEFVSELRAGGWDLVISDFQMPHFSGMEALALTRGIDPDIPFFLISGAIGEDIAVEAMRAGASDYLIKGNLTRLGPAIDREVREAASRKRQKDAEHRQQQLESAIQSILLGTASVTGVDFFRSLVRELAQALGMKVATIVELSGNGGSHASVLAIHGLDAISEGFEYELAGTPGAAILLEGWVLLRDIQGSGLRTFGLANAFGLTGMLGLRLDDSEGHPLGLLVVLDDQPLAEDGLAKDILAIFGARAASELERLRAERERNELQEQLWHSQKLEAIGTLAGGISHDINNILSSIWGHAQILEMRHSVPERDQESLQGILTACRRARDLVKQILSFSRKTTLEASNIQLGEIVQETASLLKATLPASVLMECQIDPSTPHVKADPNQMHQVLMNLCTNASHAMSTDGGRLSIRVSPIETSLGRMVRCQVSDTGSGIPDNVLPRIFEPFFTTKGPGKGTGLGLSVVHGIVRNHGGTITVQSDPAKGTTFTFDLPAVSARDSDSAVLADRGAMPTGDLQNILVVDDEEAVSDVLCQLLEILGYKPTSCQDPRVALELFRKDPHHWSAVITDRTMPGLSGEALTCALTELRPDIPIIMSSGYEGDIRTGDLSKKGVSALLPKPFQASDLATTLRRILGG